LAQVLNLAKSKNVRVDVEIRMDADGRRYPGIEQKVLDELAARDMLDRARILALEFDTLQQVRAIYPGVKTIALLSGDYFRRVGNRDNTVIVDEVASFADGIGVDHGFLSAELIDAAHHRKMSVGVWTVDTEEEMDQFAKMGVDSITTNRPDVFDKVFGR
jgi:glycerophosphoryl diester phosphodiesterase